MINKNPNAVFKALPQRGNLSQEIEHFLLFCSNSCCPQIQTEGPSHVTLLGKDLQLPEG